MSVSAADIHNAINVLWNSSGLDGKFTTLRESVTTDFPVLNDMEAAGSAVFPYCVMEQGEMVTTSRMSSTGLFIREIRDVGWFFRVHAKDVSGASRNAKQIATYLAEEIMKVFGGHPTGNPTKPELAHGGFLIAEFLRDFSIREDDDNYMWTVEYAFRVDVPVAV